MTCQVNPPFQVRLDRWMCYGTSIRLAHRFLTRSLTYSLDIRFHGDPKASTIIDTYQVKTVVLRQRFCLHGFAEATTVIAAPFAQDLIL
jgi:hypothetical protein